jgi:FixJ family two-component response regulator
MAHPAILFVVDDDASSRDAVCSLAGTMGLDAAAYDSIDAFLENGRDEPGCLVVDLHLAARHATEWQDDVRRWRLDRPVIFLAHKPATSLVVQAMQAGALTVVEKPCCNGEFEQAVLEGLARDAARRAERRQKDEFHTRLATLTEKEREVLRMLVVGKANKTMATLLGASLRTVENRRRSIFTKLGVHTVAELVAAVLKADGDATLR